jgi:hypothetical protein
LHANEKFCKAVVREHRFKPKFFMSNGAQSLFSRNPKFEMAAYILKSWRICTRYRFYSGNWAERIVNVLSSNKVHFNCLHVDYSILHVRFLVCRSIVTYVLEIKYILFFRMNCL